MKRYVIIGNGAAGTTAAETIKKSQPDAEVALITDEPYPLYNRVALPRFLKLLVPENKVIMRSSQQHEAAGIRYLAGTRVTGVDTQGRTVTTDRAGELGWDVLLVATGGRPNPLPVPGGDAPNIHNFQYLDETKAISAGIEHARSAVSVGGSFISYELTEGFRHRGLDTTWLIRGPRWLRRELDDEGGALVDAIARSHGVHCVYGDEVERVVVKDGLAVGVVTRGGRTIEADIIGVGLGLTMNTDVLAGTPVACNKGVLTDQFLRTNVPGVFAAGDIAEFYDAVLGENHMMGTWDNALAHGRIAAANMMGGEEPYVDVPTYQSGLFDTIISVLGATPGGPEIATEVRCDMQARRYRKLFFKERRLVGAVLIGSIKGKKRLMELIRQGEAVEDRSPLLEF